MQQDRQPGATTPVPATQGQAPSGGAGMGGPGSDSPMLVLISGILVLGGIAAFIAWGLTHAYPTT